MNELALNILDIANNSVRANAKNITIIIGVYPSKNLLQLKIIDDGCGMSEQMLKSVSDPFTTTRSTRKVGMGIPLFKMAAQMCGGDVQITSKLGEGTSVCASFLLDSIDRPPLGDIGASMVSIFGSENASDVELEYIYEDEKYFFSTKQVKKELGEDDLSSAFVLNYLHQMINENINSLSGGKII